MSFSDTFTDLNFGYPFTTEYNSFNSYCFVTDDEQFPHMTSQANVFESGAMIAGPSGSSDWFLNPSPEGYTGESAYLGSTLMGGLEDQFVDPHASQAEPVYDGFHTSESRCFRL
jgi:hypothetical protein